MADIPGYTLISRLQSTGKNALYHANVGVRRGQRRRVREERGGLGETPRPRSSASTANSA